MLYPSDMARNVELIEHKALVEQEIYAALQKIGESWNHISVVDQVDSTNAFLERNLSRVVPGNPYMVTADEQTVGVGRLERQWISPFGAGIALTIGIAEDDIVQDISVVPLISGLAVTFALLEFGIECSLKWPNDVVFLDSAGMRKAGGLLVQRFNNTIAVGIGLNVGLTSDQLPVEHATSLSVEGHQVAREELIAQIIHHVHRLLTTLHDWHPDYVLACSSLGRIVRVTQTDNTCFSGTAIRIDSDGALVIQTASGERRVTVGDVEHATVQ